MMIDRAEHASGWTAILRGALGRCPRCGQGKLFRAYLKPVASCPQCGEALGHIRADDGPAWLTIMIVGHIVVFTALGVELNENTAGWVSMTLWPALAVILTLAILPRAKGAFIGALWSTGAEGSQPE